MSAWGWVLFAVIALGGAFWDGVVNQEADLISEDKLAGIERVGADARTLAIDDAALDQTPLNVEVGLPAILSPTTVGTFLNALVWDFDFLVGDLAVLRHLGKVVLTGLIVWMAFENRTAWIGALRGLGSLLRLG